MIFFFLEKIRKLFKSIGKKEHKINDFITYKKFKINQKNFNLNHEDFNPLQNSETKINLVASITFLFDENKIHNLKQVCKNLFEISNKIEIYIFLNNITNDQKDKLSKDLGINIKLIIVENIVNNRLLPWYHLNLMRKLYNNKEITHFLYLEDDILIDKNNLNYWINSRKVLKRFNLIPGFIRTEVNQNDNALYAIDFVKKDKLKYLPKIKINQNYFFLNHKYPYQGMYLYDRELMKEHLFGPSSNPDCGHGAFDTNYIDPRMINLDLMAKANIGLTFIDIPNGFHNRMVTLYDKKDKIFHKCSQIKHLSNKYSNTKSWFGNIKITDVLY